MANEEGNTNHNPSYEVDNVGNMMMVACYNQFQRVEVDSSSQRHRHSGSSTSRKSIPRDKVSAHDHLIHDYFANPPLYPPSNFRNRFHMRRELFNNIMERIVHADDYFKQKADATGKLGFSHYVKMTAALRMLAYGIPADLNDDYLKIAETTSQEACMKFCNAINKVYRKKYLCKPITEDLDRLLRKAEARGFPGMLGSLDCMHWEWKNCPIANHGAYVGHHGCPTIILEAVASYDTWIWHSYFGTPGSTNDLNVLYRSPLFDDVLEGNAPEVSYTVNGREYTRGYYLTDGIYPKWVTMIQTIAVPQNPKMKAFTRAQEAYRKDVERAFGIHKHNLQLSRGMLDSGTKKILGES